MAVISDIVSAYRAPITTLRRRIGDEVREDRALITLMLACGLIFIAQWPRLSREAYMLGSDLQMKIGGALMGWIFIAPLLFYALAAVSHLFARLLGGKGSWYGGRMALFWSLLAASPLFLLHGMAAGLLGPGMQLQIIGFVALFGFLGFWMSGLIDTERNGAP